MPSVPPAECRDPARAGRTLLAADGTCVHVRDGESLDPETLARLGDLSDPVLPAGGSMLKRWNHRYVARVPEVGAPRTVILKVCLLRGPLAWLRWRRYALLEFDNMRRARERGMPVPRPIAWFARRRLGVVVMTGLVMEDLAGWQDLLELSRLPEVGALRAARLATGPLRRMAETGAFHADARDENILRGPAGELSVIDWQHAAFHPPGAPWMLEHLAAYYIRKAPAGDQAVLLADWTPELAGVPAGGGAAAAFRARVESLVRTRPSTRSRRALRPGRDEAAR